MAHLRGSLPALGGIKGTCLQDDPGHLLVRAAGRLDGLPCGQAVQPGPAALGTVKGQLAAVVQLVEHQAQGVGVHGGIHPGVGIGHLRRGVQAAVPVGQGSILQRIHGNEAQIADPVFLVAENVDILRLQIHVHPSGLPAHGHGGTQVDAQIHRAQMGHGAAAGEALQSPAVAGEQIDLKADPILHGQDLAGQEGDEAPLLRQGIQGLNLCTNTLGQLLIIGSDSIGIPVGTGQQQGLHAVLGGGQRDLLNNIMSLIRIIAHGRVAFNGVMVRN